MHSAHRKCWVTVALSLTDRCIVVRKEETHAEAVTKHLGPKSSQGLYVQSEAQIQGEKLGELLLKQILWFAQMNAFDLVYLTTFEDQDVLIQVLRYYGFAITGKNRVESGV